MVAAVEAAVDSSSDLGMTTGVRVSLPISGTAAAAATAEDALAAPADPDPSLKPVSFTFPEICLLKDKGVG